MKTNRVSWSVAVCISAVVVAALASAVEHGVLPGTSPSSPRVGPKTSRAPELKRAGLPVIDPVLVYSTLLGGPNAAGPGAPQQGIYASVVDGPGNVIVLGQTNSQNFPTTSGVIQSTSSPSTGSFLAKINPTGQSLVFSTYLNLDRAPVLAVDASGNIFIGGTSTTFQIPAGLTPYQSTAKDMLILKLNSTATAILGATFIGSSQGDTLRGLAVDSDGNVYLSGDTSANDFPTKNAYQASIGSGGSSIFLVKLDSTLSNLLYSTYVGQNSSGGQLAVDSAKNAYIVEQADTGIPVTPGALQSSCTSGGCGSLIKLNPSVSGAASLIYATYFGGSAGASTAPAAVAVDANQNAYISGLTSTGFPEVNSIQSCSPVTSPGGVLDNSRGFVAEVNAAGSSLVFSSCLGNNMLTDVVVDGSGAVYVTGTADATLPLVNPIQAITGPQNGAPFEFVATINPSTGTLLFSSLISQGEILTSIGVDSSGNIVVAGITGVLFPVFNAFQPTPSPSTCTRLQLPCTVTDGVIAKISPTAGAAAALTPGGLTFAAQGVGTTSAPQTVTLIDMGSDALRVSNVVASGDFGVQGACSTVAAAGGSCLLQVTFTPTAPGNRNGTLTITDSSGGSPHTVALSGVGGVAGATLSPTSLTFGVQQPNTTSASQQVTLTNGGAVALQISNVNTAGPFAETNTCGVSVDAGGSCSIQVTFTPTAAGIATGTLTITDGAGGSPQTVPLTGTGGTPSLGLGVASGGSATATVTAGQTATFSLSIGGQGIAGSATFTCTGAPTGATCNVPTTTAFSATTPSKISVSVTTTARSGLLPMGFPFVIWLWALGALSCVLVWRLAFVESSPRLRWILVPLFAVVLCACGGGSNNSRSAQGTQAGTYTLVVTAKVGSTSQTQNLSLIVN